MSTTAARRTVYGIKSEMTADGPIWHVMVGWKDNASAFATWSQRLSTHDDYSAARAFLRECEAS